RKIEIESPQICGKDGAVWRKLIKIDVPDWETMQHRPEDPIAPDDWYELYWALRAEAQRRIERDEEAVGAAMQQIQTESGQHRLKHVDPSEVPPPAKDGQDEAHQDAQEEAEPQPRADKAGQAHLLGRIENEGPIRHSLFQKGSLRELAAASTQITDFPPSWLQAPGEPADKERHPSIKPRGGVSVQKRSRAEPDKSSVYHQTEDNERSFLALINPAKDTAASSNTTKAPPPPPHQDQPRASASKRKRVESDEISAPGPLMENKRKRPGEEANASTAKPTGRC
ncbi:hypothetical protein MMC29_004842, partial [Sticta canariensis]|nr:hypothetical protein [Sticta canariensis]